MATTRIYTGGSAPGTPTIDASWEVSTGLLRCAGTLLTASYAQQRNTSLSGTGVANQDACHFQVIYGPLDEQYLSGNVKAQWFAREGNAAVDARIQAVIRVMANDFSTVRFTALAMDTSGLSHEFLVSAVDTNVRNISGPLGGSQALTPGNIFMGDYLVAEWGHRNHGTDASGVRVVSGEASATTDLPENETQTGNLTGGSTYRGWFEFDSDLKLYAPKRRIFHVGLGVGGM